MAYIAPIHRPSSVRHARRVRLFSDEEESIAIAKSNRIEIWRFTDNDELRLFHSQLVYGTVSMLEVLRPKDASDRELLFVGTDRFDYFTLAWDAARRSLVTVDNFRDPGEKHLRASQSQDRSAVDPTGRYVALLLWEGVLSVLRMKPRRGDRARGSSLEWMSQVRLSELFIKACTFLYSETGHPKIAFLFQTQADRRDARLVTYRATADDRDAVVAAFDPARDRELDMDLDADPGAAMLIPVAPADEVKRHYVRTTTAAAASRSKAQAPRPHLGGLLVVGETQLLYIDDATQATAEVALRTPAVFVAWAQYDATHYFLADDDGMLRLLTILTDDADGTTVTSLDVHVIGHTSRASSLVYVEARRMLFVGSHNGDSQLFRIDLGAGGGQEEEGNEKQREKQKEKENDNNNNTPTYCQLVQVMDNLAPIFDFAIMDMGSRDADDAPSSHAYASGQARLVTGSGVHKDGSVRSVRSGVGLEDVGLLTDFDDTVRALFPLATQTPIAARADTLVVALPTETRAFVFDADGGIEEVARVAGLDFGTETLWAATLPAHLPGVCGGKVLQVTARAARVTDATSGDVVCAWRPGHDEITSVSANERWVLLAVGGTRLVSLSLERGLAEAAATTFDRDQIACLHAAPAAPLLDTGVVGLWHAGSITLVDLATLQPTQASARLRAPDDTASVPRAMVLAPVLPREVAGPTLFVSMDDGTVVTFGVVGGGGQDTRLGPRKRVVLGTRHANLHLLPQADGTFNVFATTDHPSLIYGSDGRIVYAAVTATDAHAVCPFDAVAFPGTVAIATATTVQLARPDTQKQTHVLSIPMGANVRRLAYSPAERVFALGCIERQLVRGREVVTSSVRLVDEISFLPLGDALVLDADRHELIECVVRATLTDAQGEPAERFLVGTSFLTGGAGETATAASASAAPSSSRVEGGGASGSGPSTGGSGDPRDCLGRLLVVAVDHQRGGPFLVAAHRLRGPCRRLAVLEDDQLIVLGLSKTVVVARHVETSDLSGTMRKLATHRTGTYVVDLAVQGRLIAVGDLMRSTALLEYVPEEEPEEDSNGPGPSPPSTEKPPPRPPQLVPVARNYEASWVTAVCALDGAGTSWLEADAQGNLSVLARNAEGVTAQDRGRLRVTSEMNLGESVNRIRALDLGADTTMTDGTTASSTAPMVQPRAFLGTAEGALYVFGTVTPHAQDLLIQLQSRLAEVLVGLGNTPFLSYRGFRNMVREADAPVRFVDGELLERFLDLDEGLQQEVAAGLGPSVEDLRNSLEELKLLH